MIKINTNLDGAKWINITNALLLWRKAKEHRTPFICWKAPGLQKFYTLRNVRFSFWKFSDDKPLNIKNLRIFIRLPFLYWHKYNWGWEFGLPNLYLWWHEARVKI